MQSEKLSKSKNKISYKTDNAKVLEPEKQNKKISEKQEESSSSEKDKKLLNRKRGRPKKSESQSKIKNKKNKGAKNNESGKKKNNLNQNSKTLNAEETKKLPDALFHIDLIDFNSSNKSSEAENKLEEKTLNKKERDATKTTNISQSPLKESKRKSIRSKHTNFKRRNALLTNELFTEINNKSVKKSSKADEEKNSIKIILSEIESNMLAKTDIFLISKVQDDNPNSKPQKQRSNKDLRKMLFTKNSKNENEKLNNSCNISRSEANNFSRSSEVTAHFNFDNSIANAKKETESELIFSAPGSFKFDIPRRVSKLSLDDNQNIHAVIEWQARYDSSVPGKSAFHLDFVQQKFPDLLCEFLVKTFKRKLAKAGKKK